MRARLWKCNSDQLRPASHFESIGADLARAGELQDLIKQGRSSKAGAVDVTAEGSPPPEADSEVPSAEIGQPLTGHQPPMNSTDARPSTRPEEIHRPGSLRVIGIPDTIVPGGDEDVASIDTDSRATASAKRKTEENSEETDGKKKKAIEVIPAGTQHQSGLKRPIQQTEQQRLEKIALQTLRRLEREDKIRKLQDREETLKASSSSAAAPSHRDPPDESQQPSTDLEKKEDSVDSVRDLQRQEL